MKFSIWDDNVSPRATDQITKSFFQIVGQVLNNTQKTF